MHVHCNGRGIPGALEYHSSVVVVLSNLLRSITVEQIKGSLMGHWGRVKESTIPILWCVRLINDVITHYQCV